MDPNVPPEPDWALATLAIRAGHQRTHEQEHADQGMVAGALLLLGIVAAGGLKVSQVGVVLSLIHI